MQPFASFLNVVREQQGDLVVWAFPSGNEVCLPRRLALPVGVVLVVGVAFWSLEVARGPWTPARIAGVTLTDLTLVAVLVTAYLRQGRNTARERTALVLALIAATLASAAVQGWFGPSLLSLSLSLLWLGRIGVPGLLLVVPTLGGYLGILILAAQGKVSVGWVAYGAFVMLFTYAGPMFGRRQRRLQHERIAEGERARLAREVHDVLAHTLTALSVQLESARMLMEERPGDPRALGAVDRAQRLARAGIEETAQAVAALRGESPPGPESIPRLVREFEVETGVAARFEVVGDRVPVSPEAGVAIYRTAQEALTNVRRHADATEVTVRLVYGAAHGIELTVSDLGQPKPSIASSGYGLTGIGERAALLGGRFESGSMPGGFRVRLWVPA